MFRITGTCLSAELTSDQLADMKAYLNLTEMVLSNAELYITWAGMLTGPPFTPIVNYLLFHALGACSHGMNEFKILCRIILSQLSISHFSAFGLDR